MEEENSIDKVQIRARKTETKTKLHRSHVGKICLLIIFVIDNMIHPFHFQYYPQVQLNGKSSKAASQSVFFFKTDKFLSRPILE